MNRTRSASRLPRWPLARLLCPALAVLAPPPAAWSVTAYDASLGTFPTAQGWTLTENIAPPTPYPSSIEAEGLYLNTLGFGNNVPADVGGAVFWALAAPTFDFTQDFMVEASIRIVDAPDGSINTVDLWPRPGYCVAVADPTGRMFWIGLGSSTVFLSNTAFGLYGSSDTIVANFNTTDAHHVYRIQRASGGVGAALLIDGVPILELPELGPADGGPPIYFGDGTYWANSASYTAWVRYATAASVGVPEWTPAMTLRAAPQANPSGSPRVAFATRLPGSLSFRMFDVSGRQVGRTDRHVTAGESGAFGAPTTLPAGTYFYRLQLRTASGDEVESCGRVVLVR